MSQWCITSSKGTGFTFCIMWDKEINLNTGGLKDLKRYGEAKEH